MSATDDYRLLNEWWMRFALAGRYPSRPADGRFEAVCPQSACTSSVVVYMDDGKPAIECPNGDYCEQWNGWPALLVFEQAQEALARLNGRELDSTGAAAPRARAERRMVDMIDAMRLASEPIDYLCRPLAARGFLTVLAGRPGEAKSWLMLAVANAVQTGAEYVTGIAGGLKCRSGVALYVDAENGPVLMARRFTLTGMDAHGVKVADATDLRLPDEVDELEALIELTGAELVVLDSLRRIAPGAKENDSDAMAPLMAELARVARERNVALVVIHHRSTKMHSADMRGSSAIEDQADCVFVLERVKGDPEKRRRRLRTTGKFRIDRDPEPMWLQLTERAGFVNIECAEPWERADKPDVEQSDVVPAHDELASRIRALAGRVDDEGWPPYRVAAAVGTEPGNGTFKRAMRELFAAGEWEASGSTQARRLRPLDSGQGFRPLKGDDLNGLNRNEQLTVEQGAGS